MSDSMSTGEQDEPDQAMALASESRGDRQEASDFAHQDARRLLMSPTEERTDDRAISESLRRDLRRCSPRSSQTTSSIDLRQLPAENDLRNGRRVGTENLPRRPSYSLGNVSELQRSSTRPSCAIELTQRTSTPVAKNGTTPSDQKQVSAPVSVCDTNRKRLSLRGLLLEESKEHSKSQVQLHSRGPRGLGFAPNNPANFRNETGRDNSRRAFSIPNVSNLRYAHVRSSSGSHNDLNRDSGYENSDNDREMSTPSDNNSVDTVSMNETVNEELKEPLWKEHKVDHQQQNGHLNGHAQFCEEKDFSKGDIERGSEDGGDVNSCENASAAELRNRRKEHKEKKRKDELEEKLRRERERPPLWYCRLLVKHPRASFFSTLGCHALFVIVTLILYSAGYDIFPTEFNRFPMILNNDVTRLRELSWIHRNNETDIGKGHQINRFSRESLILFRNRSVHFDKLSLYYEVEEDKNIFRKEIFEDMKRLEDEIYNLTNYQDKFCQLDLRNNCVKPMSILRYFDGTYQHLHPTFYDPDFENIHKVLFTAAHHNQTKTAFQFFMSADSSIDAKGAFASLTRSSFPLGWPLPGNDSDDEKTSRVQDFLVKDVKPKLVEFVKDKPNGVDLIYYALMLFAHDVLDQVVYDLILAVGSLCFIFGFIWFQTRSFWVTSWAVLSIVTGFCCANLIYRIVLDFRYFGFFHILAIFIILGIGADDIFVFYDNWRATGKVKYPSLSHRLSDCYRRAAGTMLVTSCTTMIAFFASAVSPILPVKTFGLFSGLLVLVNYLSVITFFPAVVIVHHLYFKGNKACCCCAPKSSEAKTHLVSRQSSTSTNPQQEKKKKNVIIRFLSGKYFKFITHPFWKFWILLCFAAILGVFIYYAKELSPDEEELPIYKPSNNYGKAQNRRLHAFKPSEEDQYVTVYLVWGLKERDVSGCHQSDFRCTGKQVWDDMFGLNSPPAQIAMKNLCTRLKTLTDDERDELKVRLDLVTKKPQIACFMDNLEAFVKKEELKDRNRSKYTKRNVSYEYPLTETNTKQFMESHPLIYNLAEIKRTFYRYFEIFVSYWLSDGYRMTHTEDFSNYNKLIGEWKEDGYTTPVRMVTGAYYGTKLKFIAIEVNTTLNAHALGYATGLPIMERWEDFMKEELAKMPPELQGGFQVTENTWHWLKVQQNLASTALMGIVIGISLSFPILVFATQNIIMGFLATLTMGMVTVCVVGVIPMVGWKLGVLTSLNLCLVVGLAVDYVVHLAEGYHLSPHRDRLGRVRDMLDHVGISVLSGATTTLGASIFMMFAEIQFYVQFGIFIFSVIGFSILFSLLFFTTLLAIAGPQGDTGSLAPLVTFFTHLHIGRDKEDKECDKCQGMGFIKKMKLDDYQQEEAKPYMGRDSSRVTIKLAIFGNDNKEKEEEEEEVANITNGSESSKFLHLHDIPEHRQSPILALQPGDGNN
ncbi:uncharacterized protein LOC106155638 [Lingula anatina]|uniref:Uncharacterized protein LOC106155638 n=1 Tax=Lingula anatina TaxID=7574 RepID=A0A1S3HIR2_LINAN|nr:uncharacterized protein LOC106155638 [Lingula anatina]XP_013386012.1 uncharacterized protein LOC106155638 [Lingula anatina]XP_013386013.1 uncharacterized protein LOC106155638 [Lingula anatina]|eukprot:XP_013386010.1 uncharacterized protein LOC106155638 [Lingula anatina]